MSKLYVYDPDFLNDPAVAVAIRQQVQGGSNMFFLIFEPVNVNTEKNKGMWILFRQGIGGSITMNLVQGSPVTKVGLNVKGTIVNTLISGHPLIRDADIFTFIGRSILNQVIIDSRFSYDFNFPPQPRKPSISTDIYYLIGASALIILIIIFMLFSKIMIKR